MTNSRNRASRPAQSSSNARQSIEKGALKRPALGRHASMRQASKPIICKKKALSRNGMTMLRCRSTSLCSGNDKKKPINININKMEKKYSNRPIELQTPA